MLENPNPQPSSSKTPSQGWSLDPAVIKVAHDLDWNPKPRAMDPRSGDIRGWRSGAGMEFKDVREYMPGDDLRDIDWNVTARSGRLQVKTYVDERDAQMILLVDRGPQSRFSTARDQGALSEKALLIQNLASILLLVGQRTSMGVGAFLFGDREERYWTPTRSPRYLSTLWSSLLRPPNGSGDLDTLGALSALGRTRPKRSQIVLITDALFANDQELESFSKAFLPWSHRHELILIRVRDPWENDPKGFGFNLIENVGSDQVPSGAKQAFVDFADHRMLEDLRRERSRLDGTLQALCYESAIAVLDLCCGPNALASLIKQAGVRA